MSEPANLGIATASCSRDAFRDIPRREFPRAGPFLLIGLAVAGAEESITQGVLKQNFIGWIIPTLIAFVPFLLVMRLVDKLLHRRMSEPDAALLYYAVAGAVGIAFEWWVMKLTPWKEPSWLQVPFQLGMCSFWCNVAFAPYALLDRRDIVRSPRLGYQRSLLWGMAGVYVLTAIAPRSGRFLVAIIAVLTLFLALNVFWIAYVRSLRHARSYEPA